MAKGKFERPRVTPETVDLMDLPPRRRKIFWIIPLAFVAILLVMFIVGSILKNSDTIYDNVYVAGIDVGGLTADEARELVEDTVEERYRTETMQVILPDRTLEFLPEKTQVEINAEKAIEKAMEFGHKGSAIGAFIRHVFSEKTRYNVDLETALQMDTDYVHGIIEQVAEEVEIAPVNATLSMNAEKTVVKVRTGIAGQRLDTELLYGEVYRAFQRGDLDPVQWEYTKVPYKQVDLAALLDKLEAPVKDAWYDEENRQVVPGVEGRTFDLNEATELLNKAGEDSLVEIELELLLPKVTTGMLTYQMFGEVLEQRSSVYVNNPRRTENLRLACEAINGTILNPGDVFSFNEVVGERTAEKGYQPATIYDGQGESVDGVGGGVCQVASTIYYAALYMDLPTLMREPHMYEVTYVPAGCDATIFWDSGLDYKFRNNRENPIKLQANIDNGKVNITFWGIKESDNYVELSKPVTLEAWTDEDVEEVDETKPVGFREQKQTAYTGSKVVVTKKVFDGSGKLLREEKLESTYKSRPNIFIVGPSEEVPEETLPEESVPGELPEEVPEESVPGDLPEENVSDDLPENTEQTEEPTLP